ncbi:MAG: TlpA disulfide reductase family protein [Planctomycetota bacterium]
MIRLMVFGLVFVLVPLAHAQVGSVSKAEPRHGESVTVIYDPAAAGAELDGADPVWCVQFIYGSDDSRQEHSPMVKKDGRYELALPIADDVSSITFYFVTRHAWDRRARAQIFARDAKGAPARGAHQQKILEAGPDGFEAEMERELETHPDHWSAYRTKWFAASAFKPDDFEAMIRKDLEALEGSAPADDIGWQYAHLYGLLALGEEPRARALLFEMAREHPTHALTQRAFSDYDYQAFSKSFSEEVKQEVDELRRSLVRAHPGSELAREAIRLLAAKDDFAWKDIERVALPWIESDPLDPQPYIDLARSLNVHGEDPLRAATLVEQGIERLLSGELHLRRDVSGTQTSMTLPSAYAILAEALLAADQPGRALGAALAMRETAFQDRPDDDEMVAKAWTAIGDRSRAEAAWVDADAAGSKEAAAALKGLYIPRHGDDAGFVAHLASLRAKKISQSAQGREPAPAFSARTMDGEEVALAVLRGKVVVLNFWFIGCAPCRVEMPGLNTLVASYAERDDVVFVAFAADSEDALKPFLERSPFDYQVVPASSEVAADYAVQSWPTHVIIDRSGRVAARLTGGSADRHEDLRPLIDRELELGQ